MVKKTILPLLLAASCSTAFAQHQEERPRNIILMIGDGMGITQITAGLIKNGRKLNLERCTHVGLHKNFPAGGGLIVDSAAGATAFSIGETTFNGAIGVATDSFARPTILELAEKKSMPTALIVTSTITHATPASFFAHVPSRSQMEDIAAFLPNSGVDLFVGGGQNYFDHRKDSCDLLQDFKAKGYNIQEHIDCDADGIVLDDEQTYGLFTAAGQPLPRTQGRTYLPSVSGKACDYLRKRAGKKGFFMMIEGSQIDWGGHANQSDYLIDEMIDFDNAIGEVLKFAEADGHTLVIITADHECGAYSILKGSTDAELKTHFASDYHTPDLIPVFAYGPGARHFTGIYTNTHIFHQMKRLLRL